MKKYTDDEILKMKKINTKIAGDYLGVPPMAVALGLRDERLPIGYAIKKGNKWSYYIIAERLVGYKNGILTNVVIDRIEDRLNKIIENFSDIKQDLIILYKEKINNAGGKN